MKTKAARPVSEISPAELDTPWDPAPVAWQPMDTFEDHLFYLSDLFRQIGSGSSHIVREVKITTREVSGRCMPLRLSAAMEAVDMAKAEFELLRTCGVQVADTEWHIFEDDSGLAHALARVAVIDGTPVDGYLKSGHPALNTVFSAVKRYQALNDPGERLADIAHPKQYVHGNVRGQEGQATDVYLVDIEPRFYKSE